MNDLRGYVLSGVDALRDGASAHLSTDRLQKTIEDKERKLKNLQKRLQQANNEVSAARGVLSSIRKELGVEHNADIVPSIDKMRGLLVRALLSNNQEGDNGSREENRGDHADRH